MRMKSITKAKIAIGVFFAFPLLNILPGAYENVAVFIGNLLFACLLMFCDKQIVPKSLKYGLLYFIFSSVLQFARISQSTFDYAMVAVVTTISTIYVLAAFINSNFPQGLKILILLFAHRYVFNRIIISHIGMAGFQWYAGCLCIAFLAAAILLLYRWRNVETQTIDKQNKFLRALNFQGGIGRKSYLLSLLCFLIVLSCSVFLVQYCIRTPVLNDYYPIFDPFLNIATIFIVAQGAKRCHDLSKSGWYQFIPFNFFLLFEKGRK